MSKLLLAIIAILTLASCTHVIATNYPGQAKTELPSSWKGTYSGKLPGYLQMFGGGADSSNSEIVIGHNFIIWTTPTSVSHYSTADSLKFSELNGHRYISLHNSHDQYTVFRVKQTKTGLELFGLTIDDDIEKEKLEPYFKKVELATSDDEETGIKLFQVTIDDKKLDSYYSSGLPSKEPMILTRKK